MTIAEWKAHAASIRRAWYRCEDRLAAERKKVKALRRQVWRLSAALALAKDTPARKDATP